jgi:hypothetical protein
MNGYGLCNKAASNSDYTAFVIREKAVMAKPEVVFRNLSRRPEEKHKPHTQLLLAWPRIHPGPPEYEDVVLVTPTPNSV